MKFLLSLLVALAMLVPGYCKVIRGQRSVASNKNQEKRGLQFGDPIDEAILFGIEEEEPKTSKGDDDDDDGGLGSKGGNGKGSGDDDDGDDDDIGDDDDGGDDDDDDDDDGSSGPCHSIQEIHKYANEENTEDRPRSDHWQFYCHVFESFYFSDHCANDKCGDHIDLRSGNPAFDEMEKGICLLLQFHDDICPADPSTSCQCDSAAEWDPFTEKCVSYEGDNASEDLDLIRYCENLTGGSWNSPPPSRETGVSRECLRGCTRYIAAEAYACCPHTCDCTAQNKECPTSSCGYCKSCCETCEKCDSPSDIPEICGAEPCEPQRIRCPCVGEPDCICDVDFPETPFCPCVGEPECLCDPCGIEIVQEEDTEDEGGFTTRPTFGSQDGGSPDEDGNEIDGSVVGSGVAGGGSEPTNTPVITVAIPEPSNTPVAVPEPTDNFIVGSGVSGTGDDEENVSNDEGQEDLDGPPE